MSIRLRLAVVFTAAAAILFALGQLAVRGRALVLAAGLDRYPARQPAQPGRPLPPGARRAGRPAAGSPAPGEYVVQVIDPAGRVRGASADAGTTPLLSAAELSQARGSRLVVTRL